MQQLDARIYANPNQEYANSIRIRIFSIAPRTPRAAGSQRAHSGQTRCPGESTRSAMADPYDGPDSTPTFPRIQRNRKVK